MTVTISSADPRGIKALEIAATASSWIKCRTRDGRKLYGVPSQRVAGQYHLADMRTCDCQDAQRHVGQVCKHVLAVRLYCELVKAQQSRKEVRRAA